MGINIELLNNRLMAAQSKYEAAVVSIESIISDFVDFEFSILYQQSDGWVLLNYETMDNAPIESCLNIIKKKGRLSLSDYQSITI